MKRNRKFFPLVAGKETIKLKIVKEGEYPLKNALSSAVIVPDQIYQKLYRQIQPKRNKNPFNQCKGSESSKELTAAMIKLRTGKTKITITLPVRYGEHGDYDSWGRLSDLFSLIATGSIIYQTIVRSQCG
ncbi:hypothetical protein P7H17_12665 [Paenibacillus larvae]|nr:hypothetical protein [Paenibacillus larvae]MDT2286719.1 hypothetical protein [Paenibacillus larvae]